MRIKFWGVRGSLPSPLLPSQIKSKISAILGRITPADLENSDARERFLADLPQWLFGTVGGNTSCVSVQDEKSQTRELLIFDAGSGLRELGIHLSKTKPKTSDFHLFFSHFHWDHLMGLPFFNPAYDPSVNLSFYSPTEAMSNALHGQMTSPYFPVHMEAMNSKKKFETLTGPIEVGDLSITYRKMNHPGDSYSYKVDDGKHKFIYATDNELSTTDFVKDDENNFFFSDADLIVIDSQYTLGEAIDKYHWGHNAFSMAVDFAANWNIKHMVLFHHDPTYNDQKLFNNLQSAKWYAERMNIKGIDLTLAMEGMEIIL